MRVGELNREFEQTGRLPPGVWDEWLWGTDPDEAYEPEILMNKNHLLGVLICRFKGRSASQHKAWACGRLEIMDKHPAVMSWRELKDTLTNAQLEWPAFLERLEQNENAADNLRAVKALVDASAARFGSLCGAAWGDDVLDDMSDAQPCGERKSRSWMAQNTRSSRCSAPSKSRAPSAGVNVRGPMTTGVVSRPRRPSLRR